MRCVMCHVMHYAMLCYVILCYVVQEPTWTLQSLWLWWSWGSSLLRSSQCTWWHSSWGLLPGPVLCTACTTVGVNVSSTTDLSQGIRITPIKREVVVSASWDTHLQRAFSAISAHCYDICLYVRRAWTVIYLMCFFLSNRCFDGIYQWWLCCYWC